LEVSWRRYDRQLHDIGIEGQLKLKSATVMVAGLGGLGAIAATYLAAAGVGRLILVDRDRVEETNLNRQVIYLPGDVGREKAVVARERLAALNPEVEVHAAVLDVFSDEFEELVKKSDVIVDGMDGWRQRLRLNELAVKHGKPLVHAAVESWYGQLMTVIPRETPCLHCVFSSVGERACSRIVGPVAGVFGLLEALEVIKLVTGKGEPIKNKLLVADLKNSTFEYLKLRRNPFCPVCGFEPRGG